MKKTTWRQFGYLEGLRFARNMARKSEDNVKIPAKILQEKVAKYGMMDSQSSLMDDYERATAKYQYAIHFRNRIEEFYKEERERLFAKNEELRKMYPQLIANNEAGFIWR